MAEQELLNKYKQLYSKADQAHREVREGNSVFSWDGRERLFYGKYKHPEEPTKSVLSTGELTTLQIDRACRVMAQLPQGRFESLTGNTGANMAVNLLWEHYFIPNMNRGGSLLTKLRTVDVYSGVFGTQPVFLDWVTGDRYVGPDMRIQHPRKTRPQAGKNSTAEMDVYFLDTEVSKSFLEGKKGSKVWKDVDKVLEMVGKEDEGEGSDEMDRGPEERNKTKTGIRLRHAFTDKGDWFIWEPTTDTVLVDEKEYWCGIPMSEKRQYPRLDNYWAFSDFERGEMTQKAIDTITRYHLDGYDNYVNPPKVYDPEQVVVSSLKTKDWYVKNGQQPAQAVDIKAVAPQGLVVYQQTYPIFKANLLSMGATSDTAVSKNVDPGFGKTPEALKQQGERQGARDAWDTAMMQEFIEDAFTKMMNMIAKMGVDPYAFKVTGKALEKIMEQYPDEDYSILGEAAGMGEISINPEYIRGEYRYVMDEGSTLMKTDNTGEKLIALLQLYVKNPQIQQDLQLRGQRVDFAEAFKRIVLDQGIQDADKIIVTSQNPEQVPGVGTEGATVDPMMQGDPNQAIQSPDQLAGDAMAPMPDLDPEEQAMLQAMEERKQYGQ